MYRKSARSVMVCKCKQWLLSTSYCTQVGAHYYFCFEIKNGSFGSENSHTSCVHWRIREFQKKKNTVQHSLVMTKSSIPCWENFKCTKWNHRHSANNAPGCVQAAVQASLVVEYSLFSFRTNKASDCYNKESRTPVEELIWTEKL